MKQEISNIVIDAGGYYDLAQMTKTITHKGVEYKYLASGIYRDVYVNYETKEVIKICKAKWALMHNVLEEEVYTQSPDYCKENIAVTRLEGEYVIQELLDIKVDCGNYFREINDLDGFLEEFVQQGGNTIQGTTIYELNEIGRYMHNCILSIRKFLYRLETRAN